MGKILLGVTIGAVLASVAFISLDRSPRNGGASVEGASPAGPESETSIRESGTSGVPVDRKLPDSGADESATRATSVEDQPSAIDEVEERPAEANRAGEVARSAVEPPPALPITLPPEFDYLTENPTAWHEWLQRQPIDPNWSAQAEADLNSYLTANPEITNKYGFPTIRCRTSGCVAAFVSHDPVLAETPGVIGASAVFRGDNQAFFEGTWARQFGGDRLGVVADSRSEDGVTTIYWALVRGEQQTH